MAYSASVLQTPAPFPFNSPDEWPKWKRCFKQYRVASGLAKEDDECEHSALLPWRGSQERAYLHTHHFRKPEEVHRHVPEV